MIMKDKLKFGIILLSFVSSTSQLFFPVSSKPFCINIDEEAGKQFKFFYETTGNNPESIKVDFEPESRSVSPFSRQGAKGEASFMDTTMKICFIATDGTYKSVSIDFYTHDTAHIKQLALKSELYDLHTKLIDVGEKIKQINKNEIFEEERQVIHSDIIVNHEWRIQFFAILKLLAIIAVAGAQIYLLKAMLSKTDKGYQPV